MQRLILLIDDDDLIVSYYIKVLQQEGYKVKYFPGPDSAFEFIENTNPDPAAIILDIIMPPGKRYQHEDTEEGLKTGILMYQDLRTLYPDVPIVVLTNVSNPATLRQFPEGPRLIVAQKLHYPPNELSQLVDDMVGTAHNNSHSDEKAIPSYGSQPT